MSAKDAAQHSPAQGSRSRDVRHAAETLSAALPGLMLQAEYIANTLSQGEHGRRRSGVGETFWQFRHYSPGDAANKIDWRQSAKSQNYFVRENEWAAAHSIWLWCDRSSSMAYCSAFSSHSKLERALVLSLALAGALMRGGERVGLLGPAAVLPSSGRAAFSRLAETLLLAPAGNEDLPPLQPLPRFAKLVLVGDFLTPVEDTAARLRSFAGKGIQGHLLQVLDPAEEDLPFDGRVRFEGLQGEGTVTIGRVEDLRSAYHRRIAQHQADLRALCHGLGWSFAPHRTDRAPQLALLALYQLLSGETRRAL